MHDRLKDFFEVTGKAFRDSLAKIDKVYIAFIVILIRAFYQNYKVTGMFSRTLAGGLIHYFIEAALLCFLAQVLRSVVVYGNSGKKSISSSINNFLQPILSSLFYVYLIQMLFSMVQNGLPFSVYLLVYVSFEFLMSALIEEIYINGKSGFNALRLSAKFVCDNILTYGLLTLIFTLIDIYFTYNMTYGLTMGLNKIIYILVISVLQLVFYVVRGHLFKHINEHPYRQRKFMRY